MSMTQGELNQDQADRLFIVNPCRATSPTRKSHWFAQCRPLQFEDSHSCCGMTRINNTYRIHSSDPVALIYFGLPITRTFLLSPNRTLDPPSSRLLALHRAIAIILNLSAAGDYIDKRSSRHMEEV
ncbi:hypothetical protein GX50_07442 [[Emmonsia] crescens]|uniref:Uncharacterized protein n=1 Tax=[Emmonsia] crescens TaxID=73230 RepID=A0A2B7Z9C8_9EURO|nr:hypothetical protein GX50_07442 [Emmonsia crescens]